MSHAAASPDLSTLIAGLNDSQREAVLHDRGPLLVLAGAGSGKTRVVTMRIARLLSQGVAPRTILGVTFTNKAAREMKERLKALAGSAANSVLLCTFHSLCVRILRQDAHRIGVSPAFTIIDDGEQAAQLLRTARDHHISLEDLPPQMILARIGHWKNQGWHANDVLAQPSLLTTTLDVVAASLMGPYEKHLRALAAVDFDDLLLLSRDILERAPDVRRRYQLFYRYLMIDEYQDTNPLQFELVRLLLGPHQNICAVGDDDQAIYGFRGACLDNILLFDQHFAPCKVVKLEHNYRSTGNILQAANHVIAKNKARKEKTMRATQGEGEQMRLIACDDGEKESHVVATTIRNFVDERRFKYGDVALLYRSGPQARAFEAALRAELIPYRVVGGQSFYQKREVKDILAYLTLLAHPNDELSFRRVVNLPARGLGDASIDRIVAAARASKNPLLQWAADMRLSKELVATGGIKTPQMEALASFAAPLWAVHTHLQTFGSLGRDARQEQDWSELIASSIEQAGIRALLRSFATHEERNQMQDCFDEVIAALAVFFDRLDEAEESPDLAESQLMRGSLQSSHGNPVGAFLDRVVLDGDTPEEIDGSQSRQDRKKKKKNKKEDEREDKVTLSSIHASKGLEYPCVFLVGFEEGLLPHRRSVEAGGPAIEEERRLAYVAITRAQKLLLATYAKRRRSRQQTVVRQASRFSADLPASTTLKVDNGAGFTPALTDEEMAAQAFAKMRAHLAKVGV